MTARELFDFVTNTNIKREDTYLKKMAELAQERDGEELTNEEQVTEAVFQNSFVPRTLNQVQNPAREIFEGEQAFHQAVTGLKPDDEN